MILTILFWSLLLILFYTYLGYALVLWFLVKLKRIFLPSKILSFENEYEPHVCLFVTAFNEKDYIQQKVENSLQLNYPKNKIQYLWITDGSDDGTPDLLRDYDNLEVHHEPERRGKMHAMNRGMKYVKAPIVIFSDSNTILGENSIREIVRKFSNRRVGCVAGEKRIVTHAAETAAGAGE